MSIIPSAPGTAQAPSIVRQTQVVTDSRQLTVSTVAVAPGYFDTVIFDDSENKRHDGWLLGGFVINKSQQRANSSSEAIKQHREAVHAAAVEELKAPKTEAPAALSPEREQQIRERAATIKPGYQGLRDLLAELDRTRAELAALTGAVYGDATVRLLSPVDHARHLHDVAKAQKHRGDQLNELAKMSRKRADAAEAKVAELEGAAICPSVADLHDSRCALPVRHRGDHRNAAKNHYWSDEHAVNASQTGAES